MENPFRQTRRSGWIWRVSTIWKSRSSATVASFGKLTASVVLRGSRIFGSPFKLPVDSEITSDMRTRIACKAFFPDSMSPIKMCAIFRTLYSFESDSVVCSSTNRNNGRTAWDAKDEIIGRRNCQFGMSRAKFFRDFRKAYGTTPQKYHEKIKFQNVCSMLATTDRSFSEIANLCGFSSLFYLSKRFRTVFNTSMRKYRAKTGGLS